MRRITVHNGEECDVLVKIYGEKRTRYFRIFVATEKS
jgi:hypothetical protein